MAFKYEQNCARPLSDETLKLLESIDEFQHKVLNPHYKSLGEIHNEITVEVVDNISLYDYTIETTIGGLKKLLEDIREYNIEVEEYNTQFGKDDTELLKTPIDTKDIENTLDNHKNEPDNTPIKHTSKIERAGYYERDENNKGRVVLMWDDDSNRIAATYIHEMMHAFYDSDKTKPMVSIEYVEEPLAEYGMLHLLFNRYKEDQSKANYILLKKSYLNVERKQYYPGIAHYGFGIFLFDWFMSIEWESLLYNKQSRTTNDSTYDYIKNKLQVYDTMRCFFISIANNIYNYLRNIQGHIAHKLSDGKKAVLDRTWILRFISEYEGAINLKKGDILLPSNKAESEFIVVTQSYAKVKLHSRFSSELLSCPEAESFAFMITQTGIKDKNSKNAIEVELNLDVKFILHHFTPHPHIFVILEEITAIHFVNNMYYRFYGKYRYNDSISIVDIDKHCHYYKCDTTNNIITNNTSNEIILGFSNSTIPNNVTKIGAGSFCGCTGLTSLEHLDNVTKISDHAFMNCSSLTNIVIPENVQEIYERAFSNCINLRSVIIKNRKTEYCRNTFENCPLLKIEKQG